MSTEIAIDVVDQPSSSDTRFIRTDGGIQRQPLRSVLADDESAADHVDRGDELIAVVAVECHRKRAEADSHVPQSPGEHDELRRDTDVDRRACAVRAAR